MTWGHLEKPSKTYEQMHGNQEDPWPLRHLSHCLPAFGGPLDAAGLAGRRLRSRGTLG